MGCNSGLPQPSQVEYGCCGLSEEDAIRLHGEDDVETYLFEFSTLEQSVRHLL